MYPGVAPWIWLDNWMINNNKTVNGKIINAWKMKRKVDYSNMDWWETFEKWWLIGWLDKALSSYTNMTQWQVDWWKTFTTIATVWGLLYWWYKFFTTSKMNWLEKWAILVG